ncbi:PaaI family thioesterase [Arthrobacter sp. BL-252-APC-1A]|uniref:PaaI family thioesterase n=1 Tax=Arthrobacter sp. BL-252-APC-1A TaxID=2606622 RepID=UPI0018A6AEC4|nr:PaaI family thioesterase [Arthrobacter sp. BL-252-APC-1A]
MTSKAAWPAAEAGHADPTQSRQNLLSAVEHTRSLLDAMVRLKEDTSAAAELAKRLESVLELLAEHVQPVEVMVREDPPGRTAEGRENYRDRSPVSGILNPIAPPVQLTMGADNSARTTTTLGLPYQGPPGRVHGGFVATLLDHIMGYAAGTLGIWVFTRSLTVEYDHAVPLFEPLDVRARIEEVDGRKVWVTGDIRVDGSVVARARGLWLPPRAAEPG